MGGCLSKKNPPSRNVNGFRSERATNHQKAPIDRPDQSENRAIVPERRQHQHPHQHQPPAQAQPAPIPSPSPSPSPRTPSRQKLEANSILGKPLEEVKSKYSIGKELGRGQFGVTYACTDAATGLQYACKSILKRKLVSKNDREDVKREIDIMQHLSGQPNIVEFRGAYEDRQSVHLVMELCAGGELFDRIIAKGHYSEKDASDLCRQIVNVVDHCHFMGVMHRDLKPENFLLSNKEEKAMLKATDFGLSVFIEEGDYLSSFLLPFTFG